MADFDDRKRKKRKMRSNNRNDKTKRITENSH